MTHAKKLLSLLLVLALVLSFAPMAFAAEGDETEAEAQTVETTEEAAEAEAPVEEEAEADEDSEPVELYLEAAPLVGDSTVTWNGSGTAEDPWLVGGIYYDDGESHTCVTGNTDDVTAWLVGTTLYFATKADGTKDMMLFLFDGVIARPWESSKSTITEVRLPNDLRTLGGGCFYHMDSLATVNIPSSLEFMQGSEFTATAITSLDMSACKIKEFGNYSAIGCSSLTTVRLPDGLTTIGTGAFQECPSLTSVNIPSTVTTIKGGAFLGTPAFSGVTSLDLTDSSAKIYLPNLESLYNAAALGLNPAVLKSIKMPASLTSITHSTGFGDYTALETVDLSLCANLTELVNTFSGCTSLTSADLTGCTSLTTLSGTFNGCTSLTSVDLSDLTSLTRINNYTFNGCKSLSTVDLTGCTGITIFNMSAFAGCTSLASVDFSDLTSLTTIGTTAFDGCTALAAVDLSGLTNLTSIGAGAFRSCTSLASVDLSACTLLTTIGSLAFSTCAGLTSVTLPNSVTSIADQAFKFCRRLTSITIPDGVTSIGGLEFAGCTGLTSISIPNSVTSIGERAFQDCTSLTTITLPGTVSNIGYRAFYNDTALHSVNATALSAVPTVADDAFGSSSLSLVYANSAAIGSALSSSAKVAVVPGVLSLSGATLTAGVLPTTGITGSSYISGTTRYTYTFDGWYTLEEGGTKYTGSNLSASSVWYAHYSLDGGSSLSGTTNLQSWFNDKFAALGSTGTVSLAGYDGAGGTADLTMPGYLMLSNDKGFVITVDLAGQTIAADGLVAFGNVYVIDSVGGGGIQVAQDRFLLCNDKGVSGHAGYMPIYDSSYGGFRFYRATLTDKAQDGNSGTRAGYWVQFTFAQTAMRTLMATKDPSSTGVTVVYRMDWNSSGGESHQDYVFNAEKTKAGAIGKSDNESAYYVLWLIGARNLNTTDNVLKVTPILRFTGENSVTEIAGTTYTLSLA